MGEFALGQAVPRFEDPRLLRGGGRYVDDMVLPRMVYRLCAALAACACAHPRASTRKRAKAAPGVLAVLTGADWEASGWGDLPVPRRPEAARRLAARIEPRYPALVKDRVRWVGDYVAFVVAETLAPGRRRGRADRGRLRAAAGRRLDRGSACKPGAPRVWDDCPDNICFVHLEGDKAATDAAFAARRASRAARASSSTASPRATMEPRGCDRRLQRRPRTATPSTRRCSARTPSAPSWRSSVLEGAGEHRSASSPAISAAASA